MNKRFFSGAILSLLLSLSAFAQANITGLATRLTTRTATPSGACSFGQVRLVGSTFYFCNSGGTWSSVAGGAAGMAISGTVTSGTAGSVLFIGTGPVLSQDNANLFFDDSNNRLGIGTTGPETPVHVYAGAAGTVTAVSGTVLTIEDDTNTYINLLKPAGNAAGIIIGSGNTNNQAFISYNRVLANGFDISDTQTGGTAALRFQNLATSGASDARFESLVNAGSTGDPYFLLTVSGATNWSVGIDNSDSDNLKIGPNANPSTGTASITITTAGAIATSGSLQVGTGTQLLQIGGTTSSFPGLRRSSATLETRLADDSAYASLASANITATSTYVRLFNSTMQYLYGSSGSNDTGTVRATTKVVGFTDGSTAGGTFAAVATTPAQITANQNDYNPGGSSFTQRWSTDASQNITGLTFTATQVSGQTHVIWNVGSNNIVLVNESASSTAANRFTNTTGADLTLTANQCAVAQYDSTSSRWRTFKCP